MAFWLRLINSLVTTGMVGGIILVFRYLILESRKIYTCANCGHTDREHYIVPYWMEEKEEKCLVCNCKKFKVKNEAKKVR